MMQLVALKIICMFDRLTLTSVAGRQGQSIKCKLQDSFCRDYLKPILCCYHIKVDLCLYYTNPQKGF